MIISHVVAMDSTFGIGVANKLPWHLPNDLKRFKSITQGNTILMGRKTFESIGKSLPNRRNIVITRDASWKFDDVEVYSDLLSTIEHLSMGGVKELFIIGGAEIFNQTVSKISKLYLTTIEGVFNCDVFYPYLSIPKGMISIEKQNHFKDEKNIYDYCFETFIIKHDN